MGNHLSLRLVHKGALAVISGLRKVLPFIAPDGPSTELGARAAIRGA
jgi:hypothetical protein